MTQLGLVIVMTLSSTQSWISFNIVNNNKEEQIPNKFLEIIQPEFRFKTYFFNPLINRVYETSICYSFLRHEIYFKFSEIKNDSNLKCLSQIYNFITISTHQSKYQYAVPYLWIIFQGIETVTFFYGNKYFFFLCIYAKKLRLLLK